MKLTTSILALLFCLFPACAAFAKDAAVPLVALEKQSLLVRDLQEKLNSLQINMREPDEARQRQIRQPVAVDLLRQLEAAQIPSSALATDFFRYYHGRLQAMGGNIEEARKTFVSLAGSETVAPEAVDASFELDTAAWQLTVAGGKKRLRYWKTLGKLLPISEDGRISDSQESRFREMVEDQPLIPSVNPGRTDNNLVEVGSNFFEMKMYDRSATAYVEAIYATFGVPRIQAWYWESWLSRITAPLWLKAAEAEWQSGNMKKMADYMGKAIVFGSDTTKDEALKRLAQWRQEGRPEKPPAAQPDATKLQRIADLYAAMNMHPRAIALVKDFGQVLGAQMQPLQQRYEKEWLELVERYCYASTKCTLFGQNVSKKENRLQIVIPPPLRKEVLEEAVRTVKELAAGT